MKNIAINNIEYTGVVTLSQYIGSKKVNLAKINNAGGASLFNFLIDCLIGDFDVAKNSIPERIMLLTKLDDGSYEANAQFISLRSKPEKVYGESKHAVKYSFIIDRAMLNNNFTHIGLYPRNSSDIDSYSAVAEVPEKIRRSMSASTALIIEWELNISNKKSN